MGSGLARDLRVAIRSLVRAPLISIPAVVTLALAIGANAAVFSLLNALLLRPLPVAAPHELYWVSSDYATSHGFRGGAGWNHLMWEALRQRRSSFGGALAWQPRRFVLGAGADTHPVNGFYASGGFFSTLGVTALHGRLFTDDDDRVGGGAAGPVAVIGARLWQQYFGGRAGVVGTLLHVNGAPVTIIGITPASFAGLEAGQPFDVALPIATEPLMQGRTASLSNPRSFSLLVVLRLGQGQPLGTATTLLRQMQQDIVPPNAPAFAREPFTLVPLAGGAGPASAEQVFGRPLVLMLSGVGIVLVVACVNITNLMLARAVARRPELGLRAALGASRWLVARALVVEGAAITAVGAGLGLVLSGWGVRGLVALTTLDLTPAIDWRVVAFTMGIAGAAFLLVSAVPAIRSARRPPAELMTGARTTGSASPFSMTMTVAQVALALVLVIVAALFVRTFRHLANRPLGFDADRVLLAQVDVSRAAASPDERQAFARRLTEAAAAAPGVARAAASAWTPIGGEGGSLSIGASDAGDEVNVLANFVSPGWFGVYGVPVLSGRDFLDADDDASAPVIIVNDAFARRLRASGREALGSVIEGRQVVGVVGDAVYRTSQRVPGMSSLAFREPVPPILYAPLAQRAGWNQPASDLIRLSVRARHEDPARLTPDLRAALSSVDPRLAIELRPLTDDIRRSLAQERLSAAVALGFGALAVLLAGVGLYGVTAYAASRRVAEIGIRLALGARRLEVVGFMMRRAIATVAAGIAIGAAAAWWLTGVASSLLFGVTARDPAAFVSASAILAALALLAAFVPAWRASRIDPAAALRR